jgi:hypothetical protein
MTVQMLLDIVSYVALYTSNVVMIQNPPCPASTSCAQSALPKYSRTERMTTYIAQQREVEEDGVVVFQEGEATLTLVVAARN